MKKAYALTAFSFNNGISIKAFVPGLHNVGNDIADHWFVKAHYSPDSGAPALKDGPRVAELEALVAEQVTRIVELGEQLAEVRANGKKQKPADTREIPH